MTETKTALSAQEIKASLLSILCVFADYCEKQQLNYFLAGGTLLGAVRHKGFIPWDDDIDVFMPRPDYDRMHELLQGKTLDGHYRLIGYQAGVGTWPFAKLVDLNTAVDAEFIAEGQQLWIDIFPVDGLPDDQKASDRHLTKAGRLKRLYGITTAKIGRGKTLSHLLLKIPMNAALRLYGADRLARDIDRHARKYAFQSHRYCANIVWCVGTRERTRKSDFQPTTRAEFCSKTFAAPAGWDTYLHSVYGDYMQLPPEEKRVSHHDITVYRLKP